MNPVRNIIQKAIRKSGEPYNILMPGFDGFFENMVSRTGNNVYVLPANSRYEWQIGLPPKNRECIVLRDMENVPIDLAIDFVLCNDRTIQYDMCIKMAHAMHIPLIMFEHFDSITRIKPDQLGLIARAQPYDLHLSASKLIAKSWNIEDSTVIGYGIHEYPTITEKDEDLVLMVGEYGDTDLQIVGALVNAIPNLRIIGNNKGMTENIRNQYEIDDLIKKASIFINFSTEGRIKPQLLQAMANRCAIVSNNLPILGEILNKDNSILCTSVDQFTRGVAKLNADSAFRTKLAEKGRLASEYLNIETFSSKLNEALDKLSTKVYTR